MEYKIIPLQYEVTVTRKIGAGRRFSISPTRGLDLPRTTCTVTAIGTPAQIKATDRTAAYDQDWDAWAVEPDASDIRDTAFVLFLYDDPYGSGVVETAMPLELFVDVISEA